jgi:taurine dioxygenase
MGETSTMRDTVRVVPGAATIGAEIKGVDLSTKLPERVFDRIIEALYHHSVVFFRGQKLTDGQLVAFGRHFGELDEAPINEHNRRPCEEFREIDVISNVVENGIAIGALGSGEAIWHTDMSMFPIPSAFTILYALEVPKVGGNTHFGDMYAAYDSLPEDLRRKIGPLQANHVANYTSAGNLYPGYSQITDVSRAPGSRHPIVRTHSVTGRKALYLGRRRGGYVVGLPVEESEKLLDQLWGAAARPGTVYEHAWQAGDVLIWDNRCVIHRRDSFDPSARRVMHRLTTRGEKPV